VLPGGWLGDWPREAVEFLCAFLDGLLRRGEADAIHLQDLPAGSDRAEVFAACSTWPWRDRHPTTTAHWRMSIPRAFDAWEAARPRRERTDTKRYDTRIRQAFGDGVTVDRFQSVDEVPEAVALVERIARTSYQRGIGAGFRDTEDTRARWHAAAEGGVLDVRVLRLGGEPVAFTSGFRLGDTLWLEHLGYDPVYRRYRPGMFVLLRLIEDLSRGGDVQTIDLGVGDADYKRRLHDQNHDHVSLYLFAPSMRGLWLNALHAAERILGHIGRQWLGRMGLLRWLKSRWRRTLERPHELDVHNSH